MSTVSADKIIGKSLIAKRKVLVYDLPDGKVYGEVKPNGFVGQVYSYVVRPSGIWWQLVGGKYVKHETGAFQQTDEIRTAQDIYKIEQTAQLKKAKIAAEQDIIDAEIEQKGKVGYYVDKYLPLIILGFVAVPVVKSIIQKKL